MPRYRVELERTETVLVGMTVYVVADNEEAAKHKTLVVGGDEDNEVEWWEIDSGNGEPEVRSVTEDRQGT
jgi:hypothetical protein